MSTRKLVRDARDPEWREFLFRHFSHRELVSGAGLLRYFRFCRHVGGHMNDFDTLQVRLRVEEKGAMARVASALGVTGDSMPDDVVIAGTSVWVESERNAVLLTLSNDDNPWSDLTAETFAAAEAVERVLDAVSDRVDDPPQRTIYCVCPAYYPDLFSAGKLTGAG